MLKMKLHLQFIQENELFTKIGINNKNKRLQKLILHVSMQILSDYILQLLKHATFATYIKAQSAYKIDKIILINYSLIRALFIISVIYIFFKSAFMVSSSKEIVEIIG